MADRKKGVASTSERSNKKQDMTGYIHNVSPVKTARDKEDCRYFNMVLQTSPTKYYNGVSFDTHLHDTLKEHETAKAPLKFQNISLKRNKYDASKEEVEINKYTKIAKFPDGDINVEFKCNPPSVGEFTTIQEIIAAKEQRSVNVTVYLDVQNKPIATIKRGGKMLKRRDVAANDSTGVIKCSIWESKITEITKNGTYDLINAMAKEFPPTFFHISVSSNTLVRQNNTPIAPSVPEISDLKVREVSFPPDAVSLDEYFVCSKCGSKISDVPEDSADIVICPNSKCNFAKLKSKLSSSFRGHLHFEDGDSSMKSITLTESVIDLYIKKKRLSKPVTMKMLTRALLTDSKSTCLINFKNVCFAFKDESD